MSLPPEKMPGKDDDPTKFPGMEDENRMTKKCEWISDCARLGKRKNEAEKK